jgi:hypothetical protein
VVLRWAVQWEEKEGVEGGRLTLLHCLYRLHQCGQVRARQIGIGEEEKREEKGMGWCMRIVVDGRWVQRWGVCGCSHSTTARVLLPLLGQLRAAAAVMHGALGFGDRSLRSRSAATIFVVIVVVGGETQHA